MFNALMPGEHDYLKGKPMPGQGAITSEALGPVGSQPYRRTTSETLMADVDSLLGPASAPRATPAKAPQKKRPIMNALGSYLQFAAPEQYEAGRTARMNRDYGNALASGDMQKAAQYRLQMGDFEGAKQIQEYTAAETEAARKQEAQGVYQLFSSMQPAQIQNMAMSDPAGFEQYTGMTSEEYLQTAQRLQQSGMTPEQFHQFVIEKAQAELGVESKPTKYGLDLKEVMDPATGKMVIVQASEAGGVRPVDGYAPAPGAKEYVYENVGEDVVAINKNDPTDRTIVGKAPAKTPLVDVRIDGRQEGAFATEAGKIEAQNFGSLVEMGQTSRRNRVILDQLDTEAASIPGGMEAVVKNALGNIGIPTEGLSEIQATEALINQLVPAQRQPGSGPMSDRDLALFKASLPRLIQTTEGKARILTNMKAINDYVISEGEIASRVLSGKLTPEQGRAEMQALGNPLAGDPRTGAPSGPQPEDLKGLLAPDGDPVTEEDVAETMRKYNVTREQVIAHLRGQ